MLEPQISSPIEALVPLAFMTMARLESRATESGLSLQQVRLLGILRDREPTINQLAALMGTDKSSMSGAVARAERRGLVARVPDERDGRAIRVRLEPAGRTLVDEASIRFEQDIHELFDALPEAELRRWAETTTRLLAGNASILKVSP